MRLNVRFLILASFGLLFAVVAHADTVSYIVQTGPFEIGTAAGTSSFAPNLSVSQFNPTEGTLTSVSVGLSGSYTTTVPPQSESLLLVEASASELFFSTTQDESSSGMYSFTDSASKSDPTVLQYFTGTSTSVVSLFFDELGNPEDTSNGFSATVTYTFTPATIVQATPEPSGLLLLGTSLVGLAGASWRSWRRLPGSAI